MLIIWGLRVFYHTLAQGVFHCRKCGGDRDYRHRAGRRFITVFFIPLIPLNKTGEHVQCTTCKTRYVVDVLRAPTAAAMQSAIPAGTRAMVGMMLRTGGIDSAAARERAIEAVRGAGEQDYDEGKLAADMAQSMEAARQAITLLGGQLRPEAKEWHLTEVIRIALADGPLTENERGTAELVAADLGMTKAQALGVITMTEQAADQN
jgi:hypothetical protein